MPINWKRFRDELKKRRKDMTQEELAARAGVRWATIARLETGKIKNPSIDMLWKLATALSCRVADLLPEVMEQAGGADEPLLRGIPENFRSAVNRAEDQSEVTYRIQVTAVGEGRRVPFSGTELHSKADFSVPGRVLAANLHKYLDEKAFDELERMAKLEKDAGVFVAALHAFLEQEFPACMKLIPRDQRAVFMHGFLNELGGYEESWVNLLFSSVPGLPDKVKKDYEKAAHREKKEEMKRKREQFPSVFMRAVRDGLEWLAKPSKPKISTTAKK